MLHLIVKNLKKKRGKQELNGELEKIDKIRYSTVQRLKFVIEDCEISKPTLQLLKEFYCLYNSTGR